MLGVHVWQLGQVLGQVSCQVRLGVRLGQVRLGQVRLGQVYMYGSQVRCTCMAVRLGQVRLGKVRLGVHVWQLGVRLGQVSLGQVRCTCMAVRLVQVSLGQYRLGQVRLGQVYMYEQKQKLLEFSPVNIKNFKLCRAKKCRVFLDGSMYIINLLEFKIFDNFNCRKCRAD